MGHQQHQCLGSPKPRTPKHVFSLVLLVLFQHFVVFLQAFVFLGYELNAPFSLAIWSRYFFATIRNVQCHDVDVAQFVAFRLYRCLEHRSLATFPKVFCADGQYSKQRCTHTVFQLPPLDSTAGHFPCRCLGRPYVLYKPRGNTLCLLTRFLRGCVQPFQDQWRAGPGCCPERPGRRRETRKIGVRRNCPKKHIQYLECFL